MIFKDEKLTALPLKSATKQGPSSLLNIILEVLPNAVRQRKLSIQLGRKTLNFLLPGDRIVAETPQNVTKNSFN